MATVPLTLNLRHTALLMADFHREGMGDNPVAQERGTVQTSRAVLEAARQAGMLVVYIVVNFRPGYPEISERNLNFLSDFQDRGTAAIDDFLVQASGSPWGAVSNGSLLGAERIGEMEDKYLPS